jgi:hypothetical protein
MCVPVRARAWCAWLCGIEIRRLCAHHAQTPVRGTVTHGHHAQFPAHFLMPKKYK